MTTKKPLVDTPALESEKSLNNGKKKIMKESFVEQELLGASIVQKELMTTIKQLNLQLSTLNTTLNLIREHEFVEFHKSKWRIIAYQIALGMLFALGTVVGLASISWATYTFFKDNAILRQIVDKQLESRNFNFTEIKNRATKDAAPKDTVTKPVDSVPTSVVKPVVTPSTTQTWIEKTNDFTGPMSPKSISPVRY